MVIRFSERLDELTGFGIAPSTVRHRDNLLAKAKHLMPDHIAYMPLNTYPEAAPDAAILATIAFASSLRCGLHVSTFAVGIPPVSSPLGGFLINIEGMERAAGDRSKAKCERLRTLVEGAAAPRLNVKVKSQRLMLGGALDAAAVEARYYDLAVLPWSAHTVSA